MEYQWEDRKVGTCFEQECIDVLQNTKDLFGQKSEKVGVWNISERIEKWEDRKDLVFFHVCLVRWVEKWEGGKLFCLVREKNGRMENVVYIN